MAAACFQASGTLHTAARRSIEACMLQRTCSSTDSRGLLAIKGQCGSIAPIVLPGPPMHCRRSCFHDNASRRSSGLTNSVLTSGTLTTADQPVPAGDAATRRRLP